MNLKENIDNRRAAHHAALETLRSSRVKTSGLAIWRKLRRLEKSAHNSATAQCNGVKYAGQPFREEAQLDRFHDDIRTKVEGIFGQPVPGFFINTDPRGYSLKINPEQGEVPTGLDTDWGSYGLLASEINQ